MLIKIERTKIFRLDKSHNIKSKSEVFFL